MQRQVAKIPKMRKGWLDAWYFTSFSIGSGNNKVAWKYIWGKSNPMRTAA